MKISESELAAALHVQEAKVRALLAGRGPLDIDFALRLGAYFESKSPRNGSSTCRPSMMS
jgi:plasmid maintenance system antidote protein VapI